MLQVMKSPALLFLFFFIFFAMSNLAQGGLKYFSASRQI